MITYSTENVKADKYFQSTEELSAFVLNYGSINPQGKRLKFVVKSNNLRDININNIKDVDLTIVTNEANIAKLNILENITVDKSKLDLIKEYLEENNIEVKDKNVYKLLLKVVNSKNIAADIDCILDNKKEITSEDITEKFVVDNHTHPVNLLKAVLSRYDYKKILNECRMIYTDRGIITGLKKHLVKIISYKYLSLYSSTRQYWYSFVDADKIVYLYYLLNAYKNLDYILKIFKDKKYVK